MTTSRSVRYVPTWTATTTNPTIGNGTLVGYSVKQLDVVFVTIRAIFGSTTTYGTGVWRFGLTEQAGSSNNLWLGVAKGTNPGGNVYNGVAYTYSLDDVAVISDNVGVSSSWGPTIPITWGSGDYLTISMVYSTTVGIG